jgi:hypothetical protein
MNMRTKEVFKAIFLPILSYGPVPFILTASSGQRMRSASMEFNTTKNSLAGTKNMAYQRLDSHA